jgi:hypothetical protein
MSIDPEPKGGIAIMLSMDERQAGSPPESASLPTSRANRGYILMMSGLRLSPATSWRQQGKRFLLHPVGAIILLSVLTGIGHALLMADWDPFLSADTNYFYGPSLEILNQPVQGFRQLFVKPFFRAAKDALPMADEAKPVFVCALRLWHLGWKRWLDPHLVVPDARAFAAFVVASCVLAFLSLCILGWKLGHPWLGIATALATLWGPWGLATCYFITYTALSLTLISWAVFLVFCRPRAAFLVAGILVSLSLLTNQALVACVLAFPLIILFRKGKEGRRIVTNALVAFILGMFLPFAVGQLLGATDWVKVMFGGEPIQKPFDILELYLVRTRTERLETLPAYRHSFFLMLSFFNSWVLTTTALGILLALPVAAIVWTLKGAAPELMRKLANPAIVKGLLVLLPGLAILAVLDGRYAIKVSRAYFLAVPFLVMGLFQVGYGLMQDLPGRLLRNGIACLVLLAGAEDYFRVRDFYQTFQGAAHELRNLSSQAVRIVALQQDIYAPFFASMAPIGSIDSNKSIPDGVDYLVTGPFIPGALDYRGDYKVDGQMNLFGYFQRNESRLRLVREIPFFSLYPFLVYEDPAATFSLEVQHQFDRNSYREALGTVKIWSVLESPQRVQSPIRQPHDVQKLQHSPSDLLRTASVAPLTKNPRGLWAFAMISLEGSE